MCAHVIVLSPIITRSMVLTPNQPRDGQLKRANLYRHPLNATTDCLYSMLVLVLILPAGGPRC